MYLDRLLGTSTKINIINILIENKTPLMEKELALKSRCSVSEINRQIKDLVNSGLVHMEKVGKSKVYTINKQHFLFSPIQKLFVQLDEIYRRIVTEIVRHITRKYEISCILLLGSLLEGKIREDIVREPSDIDIVFIVRKNLDVIKSELISYINDEVSLKYGITIYPIVISEKEYKASLKKNMPLAIEIQGRGEVLYGNKPRRFS